MPIYNHNGGSEASQDKGEKYKQRVAEYYRAKGYNIERRSDHHATTEDLAAVTVQDDYRLIGGQKQVGESDHFKEIRVEAKAGDLSRTTKNFVTELLRTFLDYNEEGRWFEYHVFAADIKAFDKCEKIFQPRVDTGEDIKEYYKKVKEKHNLNEEEEEAFEQYDFDDFKRFLEDVFLHQAEPARLDDMIEDEKRLDRSKWEFYTREFTAYPQSETLIPNFLEITKFPDNVWIGESTAGHITDIFEENSRHTPVYLKEGKLYTLLPLEEMDESLAQFIDASTVKQYEFEDWSQKAPPDIVKNLLNRAIKRRSATNYDACTIVRHNRRDKVIFKHDEFDDSDDPSSKKVGRWKVTMEWKKYVAHRYSNPQVKQYGDSYYVIVETGWLFSNYGYGDSIVDGDEASELHSDLQSNNYHNPNNYKAQFRQWREYLDLDSVSTEHKTLFDYQDRDNSQDMGFTEIEDLSLPERPPEGSQERESLQTRRVDSY